MNYYLAWKTDDKYNPLDNEYRTFVSKNKKMVFELLAYEEGVEYTKSAFLNCKDGKKWCVQFCKKVK